MTTATDVSAFLAKQTPAIAGQLRAARRKLKALIPRGYEQVYDNYNALVFAYAATDERNDCLVSVAGYPRWVTLFFMSGARLDDPQGLLTGSGKQVRSIRLESPDQLDAPAVRALIKQALWPWRETFATAPKLRTVINGRTTKLRRSTTK